VDGIGTRSELMQADGIHPDRAAQPIIAERVWSGLQPLLSATTGPQAKQQRTGAQ
jgi:acyl-CoA thioesterase-1